MRVAIFASGSGTNLQAIIDANIPSIEIALVFSNKPDAYALVRAKKHNIPFEIIDHKGFQTREDFDQAVVTAIEPCNLDLIVLAGYMRILSPVFIGTYKNRIINIHPALLPSFPGINSGKQALDYGVKYTGVTVHYVDEGVDTGPIILQEIVKIDDDDTEESLLQKIHKVEHRIYPEAIKLVSSGNVEIVGRRVIKKS